MILNKKLPKPARGYRDRLRKLLYLFGQFFDPLIAPEPEEGGQSLKNLVGLDDDDHGLHRPFPPEGGHE